MDAASLMEEAVVSSAARRKRRAVPAMRASRISSASATGSRLSTRLLVTAALASKPGSVRASAGPGFRDSSQQELITLSLSTEYVEPLRSFSQSPCENEVVGLGDYCRANRASRPGRLLDTCEKCEPTPGVWIGDRAFTLNDSFSLDQYRIEIQHHEGILAESNLSTLTVEAVPWWTPEISVADFARMDHILDPNEVLSIFQSRHSLTAQLFSAGASVAARLDIGSSFDLMSIEPHLPLSTNTMACEPFGVTDTSAMHWWKYLLLAAAISGAVSGRNGVGSIGPPILRTEIESEQKAETNLNKSSNIYDWKRRLLIGGIASAFGGIIFWRLSRRR